MQRQNRSIVLFVDNFSGHNISYKLKNIQLEFFAPNLTSFVQPCGTDSIRCFKAYYRWSFCRRAIQLDDAGAEDCITSGHFVIGQSSLMMQGQKTATKSI